MVRLILLSLILSGFFTIVNAQLKIPEFNHNNISKYKSVNEMRDTCKLIITFRIQSQGQQWGPREVVVFAYNNEWSSYFIKKDWEKIKTINKVSVEVYKMEKFWEQVIENDILNIRSENELHDDPCFESSSIFGGVEDGSWFEFEFITPDDYKIITYYMPEQYANFCLSPERKKFAEILPLANQMYYPLRK